MPIDITLQVKLSIQEEDLEDALGELAPVIALGADGCAGDDDVAVFDVLEVAVVAIGVVLEELAVPVGDGDAATEVGPPERGEDRRRRVASFDLVETVEVNRRQERVNRIDVRHAVE